MMPRFEPGDYDDLGNPSPRDGGERPEGERFEPGLARARPPSGRSSGMALASLICGVMFCLPLVPSLFATIFGMIGLRETRDRSVSGRGFAVAGAALGLMGVGFWMLFGAICFLAWNFYSTETAEAEVVAKAFVQDLADGKVDAAVARSLPGIDRKPLEEASAAMKPWGPLNSLVGGYSPIQTRNQEIRWKLDADAVFSRGRCDVMIELVKDGTAYRVTQFSWRKGN